MNDVTVYFEVVSIAKVVSIATTTPGFLKLGIEQTGRIDGVPFPRFVNAVEMIVKTDEIGSAPFVGQPFVGQRISLKIEAESR